MNINYPIPGPRAPRVQNPNVVIIEEDFDELPKEDYQFLDFQEVSKEVANEILESMEMDNDTLPFTEGDWVE